MEPRPCVRAERSEEPALLPSKDEGQALTLRAEKAGESAGVSRCSPVKGSGGGDAEKHVASGRSVPPSNVNAVGPRFFPLVSSPEEGVVMARSRTGTRSDSVAAAMAAHVAVREPPIEPPRPLPERQCRSG